MSSPDTAAADPLEGRYRLATLAVVAVATFPVLFGGLVWDDIALVNENPLVRGGVPLWHAFTEPLFHRGGLEAFYRPVVSLSLAVVGRTLGPQPLGFHLLGWLLHLSATGLCLHWLRGRIRPAPGDASLRDLQVALAVATGLFALHPARAQSAAWISGLGDAFLCVFGLGAACLLQNARVGTLRSIAFGLCCGLALGSKEAGVAVLPWLLIDHGVRGGWTAIRSRGLPFALGAASTLGMLVARVQVVDSPGGSLGPGGWAGLLSRVTVSLGYDLRAMVWPFEMRVQLNDELHDWSHLPVELAWLAVPGAAALLALATLAWRSRSRPALRPWLADALTFVVLLGPTLNLIVIGEHGGTLSERYLALPSVGASALLARGLLRVHGARRKAATVGAVAFTLLSALLLSREIRYFRDTLTLFTHFAEQDPEELSTLDRIQRILLAQGRPREARAWAARRLRLVSGPVSSHTFADGPVRGAPSETTRAGAALAFLKVELRALADAERERLHAIATFLDALGEASGQASLVVEGSTFAVQATPRVRQGLTEGGMADDLTTLRARVHARLRHLDEARSLAASLPATPDALALRAQLALWAGDMPELEALLPQLEPAHRAGAARARARLQAASSPEARALELAASGWSAGARAVLDTLPLPATDLARARVDLMDGRPDLALMRLREAQASPAAAELVQRARTLLARNRGLRLLTAPF